MTQEQLASHLRATFQWVSQVERGRNLTLHTMVKLANTLGVTLESLLKPPTEPAPPRRRGRPPRLG